MKRSILAAAAVLSLACGCSSELCDAGELASALAAAHPGDTVTVGACRVTGSFTVPAGVSVVGQGPSTVLVASADHTALLLTGGTPATRVASLAVESAGGRLAIYGRGPGDITLQDVSVTVTRGVGVGIEETANVTLTRTTLRGPVTPENVAGVPRPPTPATTGTHGLVLVRAGTATITDTSVRGFAIMGAELVSTTTTWTRGDADANLSTGIFVVGGSATFESASLSSTLAGVVLTPPYGGVGADGARIVTRSTSISGNNGVGFLHAADVMAEHHDVTASDNTQGGLWVQNVAGFALDGATSTLRGNGFAAIMLVRSPGVTISDASIESTRSVTRMIGALGSVSVGDGVQMLGSHAGTLISGVRLVGNQRVGVLLDLEGGMLDSMPCSDVTVDGMGTSLGAVMQNGTSLPGWDTGITRAGATLANDPAFSGMLGVAGVVTPTDLPRADASGGIAGVVTPTD